jgi:hypothetical protein
MDIILSYSVHFITGLIIFLLIGKIIILNSGRKIRCDFFSFFWFSNYHIINSSTKESEKKRELMNRLSIVILILILFQLFISVIAIYELGN